MAMRERVTRSVSLGGSSLSHTLLERLPRLNMLANTGMWNVTVNIDCCTERGNLVCGTKGHRNLKYWDEWLPGSVSAIDQQVRARHKR